MRVIDAVAWRARGKPLLFDGNNQRKPAFNAVIPVAKGSRQILETNERNLYQ
jgi:hypothetical protein